MDTARLQGQFQLMHLFDVFGCYRLEPRQIRLASPFPTTP